MRQINKKHLASFFISSSFRDIAVLANQISFAAKQAYFARNYKKLTEFGKGLMQLSPKTESLGRYYLALAQSRYWSENRERVKRTFEDLAENELSYIRAASLLALGGERLLGGKADEETAKLFIDSAIESQRGNHLLTFVQSQSALSLLCSIHGDHQQSLRILRGLKPIIYQLGDSSSFITTDYNNSLAHELLQSGKREEAKGFALYVLKSPHLKNYPEWQSTLDEIFVKHGDSQATVIYSKISNMPKAKVILFPIKILKPEMVSVDIRKNGESFNIGELSEDRVAALMEFMELEWATQSSSNKNSK